MELTERVRMNHLRIGPPDPECSDPERERFIHHVPIQRERSDSPDPDPDEPPDNQRKNCLARVRRKQMWKVLVFVTIVSLLVGIILSVILTRTPSMAPVNQEAWHQKQQQQEEVLLGQAQLLQEWKAAIDKPSLPNNFSVGMKKEDQVLSGQIGRVNLCDEPTIKNSFPNLDYTLKGYNYLTGFPISVEHDPGFSNQIFQVGKGPHFVFYGHSQVKLCQNL